jgi:hypothetical protein
MAERQTAINVILAVYFTTGLFIVCELRIACDQYDLGGSKHHQATLFRGPSEDASVAICVTEQGSLLHRNDSDWKIYCNAGDVNPTKAKSVATLA